jgi:uroporphyrinogen decarboxylase
MAPGGGYILSSSHRITPDMPFENIAAMYEAVREFGKYPVG